MIVILLCALTASSTLALFPSDGDIRLVNNDDPRRGHVQIYWAGRWGYVCDDGWDNSNAKVVCRQLGYTDLSEAVATYEHTVFGTMKFWLDDVGCAGTENTLLECPALPKGRHNCDKFEIAGVICAQPNREYCKDDEVCDKTSVVGLGTTERGQVCNGVYAYDTNRKMEVIRTLETCWNSVSSRPAETIQAQMAGHTYNELDCGLKFNNTVGGVTTLELDIVLKNYVDSKSTCKNTACVFDPDTMSALGDIDVYNCYLGSYATAQGGSGTNVKLIKVSMTNNQRACTGLATTSSPDDFSLCFTTDDKTAVCQFDHSAAVYCKSIFSPRGKYIFYGFALANSQCTPSEPFFWVNGIAS